MQNLPPKGTVLKTLPVMAKLGTCCTDNLKQRLIYLKQCLTDIHCDITNHTKWILHSKQQKSCGDCERYILFKFCYRPIPSLFICGGLRGCKAWFCAFRRSPQRPSWGPQQPCWAPEQPLWTAQQGELRQEWLWGKINSQMLLHARCLQNGVSKTMRDERYNF